MLGFDPFPALPPFLFDNPSSLGRGSPISFSSRYRIVSVISLEPESDKNHSRKDWRFSSATSLLKASASNGETGFHASACLLETIFLIDDSGRPKISSRTAIMLSLKAI